jgi:SAM-dependent methyltransferase
LARLHHEVDTLLREVITAVDTARRNGIGGHQIRADILSCARRLLEALRTASDESGAAIDEGYVRFASEFHAYVMQGFPRILTLGFERFDIAARYELGLQNPDLEYTYQDAWAAAHVFRLRPELFVDVGSQTAFCTIVSRVVPCIAVDARPTPLYLERLSYCRGEAQDLPFADGSIPVLTSLHAPEHFGLGRYGDAIDNLGVERAVAEFLRVVAPAGHLIVSMPIGPQAWTYFNSIRVHTREMMLGLFPDCHALSELYLGPDPVSHEELLRRVEANAIRWGTYAVLLQKKA